MKKAFVIETKVKMNYYGKSMNGKKRYSIALIHNGKVLKGTVEED